MNTDHTPRQRWQAALLQHFENAYCLDPLPPREQLSPAQECQCRILGGALIEWLQRHGPCLLREREFLKSPMKLESEPIIVILSDLPGLVAAREILDPKPKFTLFFSRPIFEAFLVDHPDETFRWHVAFANLFLESLTDEDLSRAVQRYPLQPSEQYWLHRESSTLGINFGRGGDHLWKWDGSDTTLLEEGFNEWVS